MLKARNRAWGWRHKDKIHRGYVLDVYCLQEDTGKQSPKFRSDRDSVQRRLGILPGVLPKGALSLGGGEAICRSSHRGALWDEDSEVELLRSDTGCVCKLPTSPLASTIRQHQSSHFGQHRSISVKKCIWSIFQITKVSFAFLLFLVK